MGTAVKRYLKQADWLGRPKWMTDPNWLDNEEALNDLYETMYMSPDKKLSEQALNKLTGLGGWDHITRGADYNLYQNRHTTVSDALLNRAKSLYSDDDLDYLRRADRDAALWRVYADIGYKLPSEEVVRQGITALTPNGKKLKELRRDIEKYQRAPQSIHDAEHTTPEIAKRYKPTPYQMNRWLNLEAMDAKREARNSALRYALGSGAIGALAGFGLGMLPPPEYGIGKHMTGTPGRAALLAAMLGGSSALVGGTFGYRHRLNDLRARKEWAKSHLNDAREWM